MIEGKEEVVVLATKTATILVRVEPDVKLKEEEFVAQLGILASVVINMLYKQIAMTKSIPFSLSISNGIQTIEGRIEKKLSK